MSVSDDSCVSFWQVLEGKAVKTCVICDSSCSQTYRPVRWLVAVVIISPLIQGLRLEHFMKKSLVILGALVALGTIWTSAAWYTGKQLPAVLDGTLAQANRQLHAAVGPDIDGKVELLSVQTGVFSSVARYRVTFMGADESLNVLEFVDKLEHGPLPWSRVKRLALMPVMAESNYSLEKTEHSSAWFAATGDRVPLKGSVSVGYDQSLHNLLEVAPFEFKDEDGSSLSFAGATVRVDTSVGGDAIHLDWEMGRLALTRGDETPLSGELKDFKVTADLAMSAYGYYTGSMNVDSAGGSLSLGSEQALTFGKLQQRDLYRIEDGRLSLRQAFHIANIAYAGKPVGDARLAWSMQRLDPAAAGSLVKWYERHMTELETFALSQSPVLGAQIIQDPDVNAAMLQIMAGGPRVALEELSLKSASGESRLDFSVDLSGSDLSDLPFDQAVAQSVTAVSANLKLSKPMIGDLAALKATLDGLDDNAIRQASASGEMVGMIALQSEMARVKGDDILINLTYDDGQVDFNGQKMTVDQFDAFVQRRAGMIPGVTQ